MNSGDKQPNSLLLISAVRDSVDNSVEDNQFNRAVEQSVYYAAKFLAKTKFEIGSMVEMRERLHLTEDLRFTGQLTGADYSRLIARAYGPKSDLKAHITISVLHLPAERWVTLSYRDPGTFEVRASKRIIGDRGSPGEIFRQVSDATIALVSACLGRAPEPLLVSSPAKKVSVGEKVIAEGSPDADPDLDLLDWQWVRTNSAGDRQVYRGRRYVFVPEHPGEYTLDLTITELQSRCARRTSKSFPIVVADLPRVEAEPISSPRLGEAVSLRGRCGLGNACTWRQIEGPEVHLSQPNCSNPPKEPSTSWPGVSHCASFNPTQPGEYVFELIAEHADRSAKRRVAAVISSPPLVTAGPDQKSQIYEEVLLTADRSMDALDPAPGIRWEIKDCASSCPALHRRIPDPTAPNTSFAYASILNPTQRHATFIGHRAGCCSVALTLTARRFSAERKLTESATDVVEIEVVPRRWDLILQPGVSIPFRDPNEFEIRVAAGINVRIGPEWGVRAEQTLFRHTGVGENAVRFAALGGGFVGWSLHRPFLLAGTWWRPFVGPELQIISTARVGGRAGADFIFEIGRESWLVLLTPSLHVLNDFDKDHWYVAADALLGLGLKL